MQRTKIKTLQNMKFTKRLIIMSLIIASVFGCKNKNEITVYNPPAFTIATASSTVKVGQTTDITLELTGVPGQLGSVNATVAGGGTIALDASGMIGQTSGTIAGVYTAGNTSGGDVITIEVTDQQNPAKTTVKTLPISITLLSPPTVTLSSPFSINNVGNTASVDLTFGAEAGLASYSVILGTTEYAAGTLSGASQLITFDYLVKATDPDGDLVFTVKVIDSNGIENSTNYTVTVNPATPVERLALAFTEWGNQYVDPVFTANSIIPTSTGVTGNTAVVNHPFIVSTNYKGALDPNAATPWYAVDNWSFYSYLVQGANDKVRTQGATLVNVSTTDLDGDGVTDNALTSIHWTKDKTYLLNGFVFVSDGQTLTIDAGTVIKGKPGLGTNASALIIARGGKIMAMGSSLEPIIMTYEADPLDGTTAPTVRGQWGGLILLGKARLNSANGTTSIEGIPTTEPKGLYGGNTDDDSSGELHYVSIRHGGTDIGAGNEINGLTLGGVGSNTVIEYVEVIGNTDDGVEYFGGTVNVSHFITAYQGDDGLDYDEGYRGANQFIIVHQDPAAGDRGGEHDGGTTPETGTPYAIPYFVNVTSTGKSLSRTITFRDNAGGYYYNSIFTGYGKGIDIEDIAADVQDSYKQFLDGNLQLKGNIFFNIGAGSTGSTLFTISVI